MGCWEGTCQVSGLSISRNTPVVVFPIVFMYGKWTPCWIPIHGKYNEVGSITAIECNFMTDRIVNDVLTNSKYSENHDVVIDDDDNIIPIPPSDCIFWIGKDITHSIDNGKIPTTIEELLNVLEREGCRNDVISVKGGYKHEWCRLSLCMVRKDVYDWMLAQYDIDYDDRWNGKDWALLRDYCNNDTESSTDLYINNNFELSLAISRSHDFGEGEYALIDPWNLTSPYNLMLDERQLWFKTYSEFYRFSVMFQRMRRSWGLPAQGGSQDDNVEITQLFSKFMLDVCETEIHRFDEE